MTRRNTFHLEAWFFRRFGSFSRVTSAFDAVLVLAISFLSSTSSLFPGEVIYVCSVTVSLIPTSFSQLLLKAQGKKCKFKCKDYIWTWRVRMEERERGKSKNEPSERRPKDLKRRLCEQGERKKSYFERGTKERRKKERKKKVRFRLKRKVK